MRPLDSYERRTCERIREAHTIKIVLDEGTPEMQVLLVSETLRDIRTFRNGLRLALQNHYSETNKLYNK